MAKNETLRVLQRVSEHILRASSPADIAQKLAEELPSITRATAVRLYRFNAATKSLEAIPCQANPEPAAASIERPPEGLIAAAVRCYKDRAAVNFADARRDVEVNPTHVKGFPRSAFFAPVMFGMEPLGVVEATSMRRFGSFTWEERSAIQQLANLVGALFKLQQQGQSQERVSRAERQAASAELISEAASGLQAPVERIQALSTELGDRFPQAGDVASSLRAEALRASEVLSRLSLFSRSSESAPAAFDLNALLRELIRFRTPEWTKQGVRIEQNLSPGMAMVHGQRGQVERALLDLMLHAERSAAVSADKVFTIGSGILAGRIVVELRFPSNAAGGVTGLSTPRQVAENHGGELRVRASGDAILLEMELPAATTEAPPPSLSSPKEGRAMTLMLVDSDTVARAQLMMQLAPRGHRLVPVPAEEATALAKNLRFDCILWAMRPSGPKWSDYQNALRESIPAFVLVSDAYDAALAASLSEGGGFLLARPVQDTDLDLVLTAVQSRAAAKV